MPTNPDTAALVARLRLIARTGDDYNDTLDAAREGADAIERLDLEVAFERGLKVSLMPYQERAIRAEQSLAARDAWIERAREAVKQVLPILEDEPPYGAYVKWRKSGDGTSAERLEDYNAAHKVAASELRAFLATTPEPASVHTGQAGHTGFVIERNEP